ncbi:exocyst complex component [Trichonephila clavipes]|nr:exocyst complex component [Trichonephila clavipes]
MHVSTDQERSSPRRFLKSIYETCISSIRYLFRFDRRAMARQIGLEDSNESNAILLKYISVITAQRKLSVFDIIPFTTGAVKSVKAQASSRWHDVGVWRRGQLRCRPRHLIMVQNYEVRQQ